MPDVVQCFGPLFSVSAFPLENMMGDLVANVQTATNVQQQVMAKHMVDVSIRTIIASDQLSVSRPVKAFGDLIFGNDDTLRRKSTIQLQIPIAASRFNLNEI